MRRRDFITLVGGAAAAWPLAARAQEPSPTVRQARVGILSASPPTPAMLNAFREGMRERGYIEGQNLYIDVRWPQGTFEQDPAVAAELAKASVEVIVAWSTPAVIAGRITLLGAAAHRWLVSCGLSFLPAATSRQNVSIRSCQLGTIARLNVRVLRWRDVGSGAEC